MSQSDGSSALTLPSSWDVKDYVLREPSQGAGEASGSEDGPSFPCSSDVDPDSSNPNTGQSDPWAAEGSWLDPSARGHPEAGEEGAGLRAALDRFYAAPGQPLALGSPLAASVCHRLSRKIAELEARGGPAYALRRLQVARVVLSHDARPARPRARGFYPQGAGGASPREEKPTPGLSKDVLRFLLQQSAVGGP
ncbi:shieldin complex subunit 1 [Dasypus novemcinctus]|uniref:shieldin complex subunit 1 n=1 Tax=Dasypus novemcinctus TaxID=9361 RepID=UPI00265D9C1C|nr:shieldin complex subunit 1 isoform X2 [Dasypus novemcinctus]